MKVLRNVTFAADVVIDFSNAAAVDGVLDYCAERRIPVVLCTTGLSETQLQHSGRSGKGDGGTEVGKYVPGNQSSDEAFEGCSKGTGEQPDLMLRL